MSIEDEEEETRNLQRQTLFKTNNTEPQTFSLFPRKKNSKTQITMAKGVKRSTKKVAGKKSNRKGKKSFKSYISKVNKKNGKGLSLSSKSAKILNSFCNDMFDKIATQAAALCRANKKSTIRAAEIQTAVRLTLPSDLARHAASEASKAVTAAMK